ncbi:S41 family peptidase [Marinimicrobium sp. ABcell2]|uniref:S41 family peptidase n=1 Tax=Marinimicrobium sp. ABcell2 TaxID=3069751 RepID=UPI0027AE873A|nr:S41 family peptidase [Marinimicrobium sp. ABcell2]MDQ2076560.1 S41 family peptidase [Marinimicrobium sp. ABcell2]
MLYAQLHRRAARAVALALLAVPVLALADSPQKVPTLEPQTEGLLPLEDLRTFTRVYDHIRSGYVEEVSDSQLLEYAIRGMIAELDPHSAYLDERSFEDLQVHTSGEFGGIGIEVGMEDGFVKVISPIDDTPAHKAGIQAGDLIIRLDDQPVKGMSLSEAVEKMRGPKDSKLDLTIIRQGVEQPMEITLVRDVIRVRSVRTQILGDEYAYVRIAQFQVGTGPDMVRALKKMKEEHSGLKGIILDLRNNPGGVLQASVDVADAFLDSGLVVYTEGRLENSDIKYYANPGDIAEDLPIVVLINEGSASASEIVAGALQDQGRAMVLGTRSFGKGSVQTVVPISETRAVKLTTALYYTPDGRSIQAQGIAPDITIERAKVTALPSARRPTEADLSRHLGNVRGGQEQNSRTRAEQAPKNELLADDNQLSEALNMLKGLSIYQSRKAARQEAPKAEPATDDQDDSAAEARLEP